jgi:hypothetical protein
MKSPFPGMDPYLEASWGDVHTSLVTYARDLLRPQMPADLRVRVEEHVTVQRDDGERHGMYPDFRVVERPNGSPAPAGAAGTAAVAVAEAEPLVVPLEWDQATQRSIEIIDSRSGNRVVTAIEFLSLANKSGRIGPQLYRQKQRDLIEGGVSLVEIDLLRDGLHVLAVPLGSLPEPYARPYRVCVVRGSRPVQAEVYRLSLRERLPVIKIPLRETDPDARLDLQALIELAYQNGDYGREIDYRRDPMPPLPGEDAAWADALLRAQGRR